MKRLYSLLIPFAATLAVTTFFYTVTASAHGENHGNIPATTAEQAAEDKDNLETIKNFVLHAKHHFEGIPSDNLAARAEFYRETRGQGTWNHGSVYLIMLASTYSVINHGLYTETLFGESLGSLDTVMKLKTKLAESAEGEAVCEQYTYNGVSRQACAVGYTGMLGGRPQMNILIGGFDHDEKDQDIVRLDCTDYEPAVTAMEVKERQTRESLEDFVEGAIIRFGDVLELQVKGDSPMEAFKIVQCFSKPGHWKDGPIYLFVMTADTTVVLNGLNQELTGTPFVDVFDEDGVDIGKEIIAAAGENGAADFVEYKWDDPSVDGDEVNESGRSPGTSPKISYVEGKIFPQRPQVVYIFGSGIYPKDDDDGCAIAGTGSEPGSIVFNMFLIIFSMVLTVSLARLRRK